MFCCDPKFFHLVSSLMTTTQANWNQLFKNLGEQPFQVAIVCTGGGSGAIWQCFHRAGASKNFVEGIIPYSNRASQEYLGITPAGSRASQAFAQQLASVAFERAKRLSDADSSVAVGISLAAVLPTLPANPVEERIHVAIHRNDDRQCWSKGLVKGEHTRESAESVADDMIYDALMHLHRVDVS